MGCFKGIASLVLVIFNFVFAAGGLLMLAVGIAARVKPQSIIDMFSYAPSFTNTASKAGFDLVATIQNSAIFLIVLGAIVATVSLLGCIGACCNVKWMLSLYIVVLVLILLAEIALIIFAAVFPEKMQAQTQPAMYKSLLAYKSDGDLRSNGSNFSYIMPNDENSLAWASMQIEAGCCGAYGSSDYNNITFIRTSKYPNATVPVSCCKLSKGPGTIPTKESDFENLKLCLSGTMEYAKHINTENCYSAVESLVKQYARIAIGIAAGIVGVEVILILLSLWICCTIGRSESKAL